MAKKIVVVGSGLGGSVFANSAKAHGEVTVLEKGPRTGIRYPTLRFIRSRIGTTNTFCYGAGGTTNLWDNGLIPMRASDITEPAARAVLADAEAYTDEAAFQLHFKAGSFRDQFLAVQKKVNQLMRGVGGLANDIDCLLYPKGHKPQSLSEDVDRYFAVQNLTVKCSGNAVTEVGFVVDGESRRLPCDQLVISAGTMGSPQVVNTCLRTVGASVPLAGRGLIDHPMGFVGKIRVSADFATKLHHFARADYGSFYARHMIRVKSACGAYSGAAFLRPSSTMTNDPKLYRFKSALGASKGIRRIRNAFSPRIFHPDVVTEIHQHLTGRQSKSRTFAILFITEQRASANEVQADENEVAIDWQINSLEFGKYREMLEKLKEILAPNVQRIALKTELSGDWLWSAAHHSGTVAFGDGEHDLLDRNLRLKALNNVFVCDASVLPEHSYTNTGLTIAQLALRLSGHLQHG
ncbi:MAG: GMC oxidoreductase [Pseudomonadota bacterium]